MQAFRHLTCLLAACVAGTTGCTDTLNGPASTRDIPPDQAHHDFIYGRLPTEQEYLDNGGLLQPSATAPNPTVVFVTDAQGNYHLKVSAVVTFQYVNETEAKLWASIISTSTGATLASREQPYYAYRLWPLIAPVTIPLGFTLSAGSHRCGIRGEAVLTASGTLRLLNNNWSPITFYSFPNRWGSNDARLPDCEQRKTTEEPADNSCDNQSAFQPTDCGSGGGSSPPAGGGGGGCALWVRRVWVSYDGGLSWQIESESFFTRC